MKVFCGALLVAAFAATAVASGETDKVEFIKCCLANETYQVGLDDCRPSKRNNTGQRFTDHGIKTTCSNGYIPTVVTLGHVNIANGSLYSQDGAFLTSDFCVEELQFHAEDHEKLIARYCVPDPCDNSECLRKCCPAGMILNQELGRCQMALDSNFVQSHAAVRHGVFPRCPHGFYMLESEEFTVHSNGSFNLNGNFDNDNTSDEYCVDNVITYEGSQVLGGLRCFPHSVEIEPNDVALNIYPYALYFSSIFLIATFIIYALLPDLHNTQGLMVMAYSASMSVMFVGLATIQISPGMSNEFCIGSAVIVHYTFLATFTWLNALCFDIWHSLSHVRSSHPQNEKTRFLYYSLYAWGVPLVVVIVGQILDNVRGLPDWVIKPQFGVFKCFFAARNSYFAYLYGPMSVLLLANLFFFVASSIILCRRSGEQSAQHYHAKKKFVAVLVLFFVMGVTWITEVVSFAFDHLTHLWISTDILNIASGLFVFLIFVCRRHVWNLLTRRFPRMKPLAKLCPCCCRRSRSVDLAPSSAETRNDDALAKSQNTAV